jgi:hypothetical protein
MFVSGGFQVKENDLVNGNFKSCSSLQSLYPAGREWDGRPQGGYKLKFTMLSPRDHPPDPGIHLGF